MVPKETMHNATLMFDQSERWESKMMLSVVGGLHSSLFKDQTLFLFLLFDRDCIWYIASLITESQIWWVLKTKTDTTDCYGPVAKSK